MKRKFLGAATATMMLAGSSFLAFGSSQPEECQLKGTPDCPIVQNCPLKGTPECTLAASTVRAEVLPCCKKK
ncbi:hypothetical protein I2I11_02490 [Pontibacter sp. 172403-2]|uniref:hypothetical protein n=1 Tax=Pontibacter rufus TaxID=2791028 RepID=UPI0018AFB7B6|nr:hypothetical protein [Pontibacter sp. 172403-2]MBF9252152.1 hypothetical protein [Pontibacter sp. 172403-2]